MTTKIDYLNPINRGSDLSKGMSPGQSGFGPRYISNKPDASRYHKGLDYSAANNTPIYAAADGVVIKLALQLAWETL